MKKKESKKEKTEKGCEKCEEYLAGWKRALADYDNVKKGLVAERQSIRRSSQDECAHAMIPVLDNFQAALKFKPETDDANVENWLQGVLHVKKQLEDALESMGFERYAQEGESFDPNMHDAADEKKSSEDSGTILEIIHTGWKKGEQIVRPAKVIISK